VVGPINQEFHSLAIFEVELDAIGTLRTRLWNRWMLYSSGQRNTYVVHPTVCTLVKIQTLFFIEK
ncbi:hypothetical protein BGZ65_000959, partial [Modicella reniformis]